MVDQTAGKYNHLVIVSLEHFVGNTILRSYVCSLKLDQMISKIMQILQKLYYVDASSIHESLYTKVNYDDNFKKYNKILS